MSFVPVVKKKPISAVSPPSSYPSAALATNSAITDASEYPQEHHKQQLQSQPPPDTQSCTETTVEDSLRQQLLQQERLFKTLYNCWRAELADNESKLRLIEFCEGENRSLKLQLSQKTQELNDVRSLQEQLKGQVKQLEADLAGIRKELPVGELNGSCSRKMMAVYEYTSRNDKQLTLKVGDVMTDVTRIDEDWATGTSDGSKGFFPLKCCMVVPVGRLPNTDTTQTDLDDDVYDYNDVHTYECLRGQVYTCNDDEFNMYDHKWPDETEQQQQQQPSISNLPAIPDTDISNDIYERQQQQKLYLNHEDMSDYLIPAAGPRPKPLPDAKWMPQAKPAAPLPPPPPAAAKCVTPTINYLTRPEQTFSVTDRKLPAVVGLCILNKRLYIVREKSDVVQVYQLDPVHICSSIRLQSDTAMAAAPPAIAPGNRLARMFAANQTRSIKPCDIIACAKNNCLYISDRCVGSVVVVFLAKSNQQSSWLVDGIPCGLSITPTNSHVLVCFPIDHRLNEYSPDGKLIHRINLPVAIVRPWKGVEIAERQWIVCHGNDDSVKTAVKGGIVKGGAGAGGTLEAAAPALHRVCLVDGKKKQMTASHGGQPGSALDQLHEPLSIVADRDGRVLVADCRNNRVKLLNADLQRPRELLAGLAHEPRRLCLCPDTGCLYVGLRNGAVLGYKVMV